MNNNQAENVMTLAQLKSDFLSDKAWLQSLFKEYKPELPTAQPAVKASNSSGEQSGTQQALSGEVLPRQAAEMASPIGGLLATGDNLKLPILRWELGPVASAVVGTSIGLVVSEAIDGAISTSGNGKFLNPIANVAAMGALVSMGDKLIGKQGAYFAAGVIAVKLAMRYTPIANWIQSATSAVVTPVAGAVGSVAGAVTGAQASAAFSAPSAPAMSPRRRASAAFS